VIPGGTDLFSGSKPLEQSGSEELSEFRPSRQCPFGYDYSASFMSVFAPPQPTVISPFFCQSCFMPSRFPVARNVDGYGHHSSLALAFRVRLSTCGATCLVPAVHFVGLQAIWSFCIAASPTFRGPDMAESSWIPTLPFRIGHRPGPLPGALAELNAAFAAGEMESKTYECHRSSSR